MNIGGDLRQRAEALRPLIVDGVRGGKTVRFERPCGDEALVSIPGGGGVYRFYEVCLVFADGSDDRTFRRSDALEVAIALVGDGYMMVGE